MSSGKPQYDNCYWAGTFSEFRSTPKTDILDRLCTKAREEHPEEADIELQVGAWKGELETLDRVCKAHMEALDEWGVVLEYRLAREGGRRPDVLLISEDSVFVLEFKTTYSSKTFHAHVDQVSGYRSDLKNYHGYCWSRPRMKVYAVLVYMYGLDERTQDKSTVAIGAEELPGRMGSFLKRGSAGCGRQNLDLFLAQQYSPKPTIIDAARSIFKDAPLPRLRAAESLGLDDTVAEVQKLADRTLNDGQKALIMITGAPGAGKTYAGLRIAYSSFKGSKDGIFLSGNGPLVMVLQYILANKTFVQGMHNFLDSYGSTRNRLPEESVIVFDEAQRAWDKEFSRLKRHQDSEPHELMSIAARSRKGMVIVALVGEGQEISKGEESGLGQWQEAVDECCSDMRIYCPPGKKGLFPMAEVHEKLHLHSSMRTDCADYPEWVEHVLDGDSRAARELMGRLKLSREFPVYVTRDLGQAREYIRERYKCDKTATYGQIASSKAPPVPGIVVDNSYRKWTMQELGEWFAGSPDGHRPPFCTRQEDWVTEFQCQGLELDFALLAWGTDLRRAGGSWVDSMSTNGRSPAGFKNPRKIEENIYRVLLTRGRDGMVIYVPRLKSQDSTVNGSDPLQETYDFLVSCGCCELE